jgi:UDP-3-O-[3-hydroxymyristoyl] glucosamine N-acyltransferase
VTLAALAARLGGELQGDGSVPVGGLAGLEDAGPGDLSFLADPRRAEALRQTRAAAVLVARDWDGEAPCPVIRVADPHRAMTAAAQELIPAADRPAPGVHPTAVLAGDVELGEGVSVGPHVVLGRGVRIGARTVLQAGCVLAEEVTVGEDGLFYPHVTVRERCRIGHRVILHNGAVIGSDGFGYDRRPDGSWSKIPQLGIVVVGDDVEIGANTTVDRARFGRTVIGNGVKLDNLVQIAHNVQVGDHTAMAALCGIAGSTRIGRRCQLGGKAATVGHVTVGDDCVLAGATNVVRDIEPGQFVMGYAATPHKDYKRIHVATQRLPQLVQTVRELEQKIRELTQP